MTEPEDDLPEHKVMYWTDETRPKHMKNPCTCPHGWRSYGRLYGVSMGKGWVRLSTTPNCPEHDSCHHFTEQVRKDRMKANSWDKGLWCPKHETKNCPS